VELELGGDQLGQVLEGLGRVEDVLHDAHGFLGLVDEFVLCLFDLGALGLCVVFLGVGLVLVVEGVVNALDTGLGRIEIEAGVLDVLTGALSELQVGVEGSAPASEEALLNALVLVQASLANLLFGDSILLQSLGERVVGTGTANVALVQQLAASQGSASDSMVEGLGLRLCLRGSGKGSLSFGGRGGARQKLDLLGDVLGQVGERLADVGRVVVCFVGVLRCDREQLLVHKLQGIDALLELNVVWRQLRLVLGLAKLLLDVLLRASCKGREGCTAQGRVSSCSCFATRSTNPMFFPNAANLSMVAGGCSRRMWVFE